MKKLRIASFISGLYTIPPEKGVIFAPMLIAKHIAEGLTKKGHKVYFFAPKGSSLKVTKIINGNLPPFFKKRKSNPIVKSSYVGVNEYHKIINLWEQYLLALIYKKANQGEFDIIHIHPIDRALPLALSSKIPTIYTLHDPLYSWRAKIFKIFESRNQHLISISNAQRKPAPNLNWLDTIYNGLDLKLFPFSKKPKNHLLFLGRILPTKGPDIAIKAAMKAREKLIIAGLPKEGNFWEKRIKPYLNKNIKYVGNVPYEKTYKYYGQAKAAIFPIQWQEPFGLTFIEAMACGTPVITFDRGSAREVIKNGKTGFIVKNINEMVRAMKKIDQIDRRECRKWVEKKFTIEKMVENYEKVFYKALPRIKNLSSLRSAEPH